MAKNKGICFIGMGNMAEALLKGILEARLYQKDRIIATDILKDRLQYIKECYGIEVSEDNREGVKRSEIIILAVKPQVMEAILAEIRGVVNDTKLIISIVAGVTLSKILSVLNKKARVIRAMPNTSVWVREGATAIAPGIGVSQEDMDTARRIFESVGKVVAVEERMMDAVTGLSGSGPAYIFMIIEALSDGGVKMGLPREVALLLAVQTVLGSAKMVMETREHPGRLKDMVASPGGTTISGIHKLEEGGLRSVLINAVEAATKRAQELGKGERRE